jgi:chloramphenicol 3-O phosphotransferase
MVSTRVIILNGVGSVGKSSTAKALQTIAAEPFLLVQMDTFFDMLPEAMIGHPDGVIFETAHDDGKPSVMIRTGRVMDRAMHGMRHAIAAMAGEGNDLIVDDVMLAPGEQEEYRRLLAGFELRFVGLFAPLAVLEARERDRGDRLIGLARWQYDRVHSDMTYDLRVDAAVASPLACAQQIKAALGI